jgi:hypothetical protein
MEEVLLKELQKIAENYPENEFNVTYFDNNSFEIKSVNDKDFKEETNETD